MTPFEATLAFSAFVAAAFGLGWWAVTVLSNRVADRQD